MAGLFQSQDQEIQDQGAIWALKLVEGHHQSSHQPIFLSLAFETTFVPTV